LGGDIFYYIYVLYLLEPPILKNMLHYFSIIQKMTSPSFHSEQEQEQQLLECVGSNTVIPYKKETCLDLLKTWIKTERDLVTFFIALESYLFYEKIPFLSDVDTKVAKVQAK
jgi:hypothetical protein